MWRVSSDGPEQHVTPDGVMDLMWFQDRLVVAGPDTRTMVAETRAGEPTWGLRFAPGVAHALLGVPAHELTDRRVELSELVALPRHDGLSFDNAADALERVFLALWTRAVPERSVLRVAASLDRAARDGLDVRATAELHGLSERSLRRLSSRLFGYGPKTLMLIHRFQHALHLARAGLPLSAAAATAGYADQAHFNRESKRLTGRTPGALRMAVSSKPGAGDR
jgi:AraC-like DNA-binding protein